MGRIKKSSFQSDPIEAWTPFFLLFFFGRCSSAEALLPLFSPYFNSLVLLFFFSSFFFPGGWLSHGCARMVGW